MTINNIQKTFQQRLIQKTKGTAHFRCDLFGRPNPPPTTLTSEAWKQQAWRLRWDQFQERLSRSSIKQNIIMKNVESPGHRWKPTVMDVIIRCLSMFSTARRLNPCSCFLADSCVCQLQSLNTLIHQEITFDFKGAPLLGTSSLAKGSPTRAKEPVRPPNVMGVIGPSNRNSPWWRWPKSLVVPMSTHLGLIVVRIE